MKPNKLRWLLAFFLIFGVLGYWREFFFVNMNNIMFMRYYERESIMPVPNIMKVFSTWEYDNLYYSKYLFTLLWTGIFFFANYLALRVLSENLLNRRILIYSYGILLVISGASMLYGYFVNERLQNDEYTLSRWLMGVAQSPLICLILLASEKLIKPQRTHD